MVYTHVPVKHFGFCIWSKQTRCVNDWVSFECRFTLKRTNMTLGPQESNIDVYGVCVCLQFKCTLTRQSIHLWIKISYDGFWEREAVTFNWFFNVPAAGLYLTVVRRWRVNFHFRWVGKKVSTGINKNVDQTLIKEHFRPEDCRVVVC